MVDLKCQNSRRVGSWAEFDTHPVRDIYCLSLKHEHVSRALLSIAWVL